jgi:hypothetical protein
VQSKDDDLPSYLSNETVITMIKDNLYSSDFKGNFHTNEFNRK